MGMEGETGDESVHASQGTVPLQRAGMGWGFGPQSHCEDGELLFCHHRVEEGGGTRGKEFRALFIHPLFIPNMYLLVPLHWQELCQYL